MDFSLLETQPLLAIVPLLAMALFVYVAAQVIRYINSRPDITLLIGGVLLVIGTIDQVALMIVAGGFFMLLAAVNYRQFKGGAV